MKPNTKRASILGMLTLVSVIVLLSGSGGLSDQKAEKWVALASAKEKKNPIPADEASIAAGKKWYAKECLSCHGKKGEGDGPNAHTLEKSPGDLTSAKVQDQTDGELFWKITTGRKPMPSAKKALTEEQRWQVVNYMRTFEKKKEK